MIQFTLATFCTSILSMFAVSCETVAPFGVGFVTGIMSVMMRFPTDTMGTLANSEFLTYISDWFGIGCVVVFRHDLLFTTLPLLLLLLLFVKLLLFT